MRQVMLRLDLSKANAKVVTVAGTNGKGSCVHALSHLLCGSGKSVGTYTSPHIERYNERIAVNQVAVSDQQLIDVFQRIDEARGSISLTYFEFGTLAALCLFSDATLDYWVLEVGLGGRLDAVNVIDADVAIITSIDLDHMEWLGDSRDLISAEKLGILREGIPCVCAETDLTPTMKKIFAKHSGVLMQMGEDFGHTYQNDVWKIHWRDESQNIVRASLHLPNLPLDSVVAAVQAAALLSEIKLGEQALKSLEHLGLAGRFEQVSYAGINIIFDVAHNPAAGALLASKVKQRIGRIDVAVVAMMKDKNIADTIAPMRQCVDHWVVSEIEGFPRSERVDNLYATLCTVVGDDAAIEKQSTVALALENAIALLHNRESKSMLVFGSFYTVAQAKLYLNTKAKGLADNG